MLLLLKYSCIFLHTLQLTVKRRKCASQRIKNEMRKLEVRLRYIKCNLASSKGKRSGLVAENKLSEIKRHIHRMEDRFAVKAKKEHGGCCWTNGNYKLQLIGREGRTKIEQHRESSLCVRAANTKQGSIGQQNLNVRWMGEERVSQWHGGTLHAPQWAADALKPRDLKGLIYVHPADNSDSNDAAALPDCQPALGKEEVFSVCVSLSLIQSWANINESTNATLSLAKMTLETRIKVVFQVVHCLFSLTSRSCKQDLL